MKYTLAIIAALIFGSAAQAQMITECDTRASAVNLVEPWEDNIRLFSNGKARLALLDTRQPAAAPFYLLVISPPYDVFGYAQCKIVSLQARIGFSAMAFAKLESGYNPATGLNFKILVKQYEEDRLGPWQPLTITLNQATGLITASFE